MSGIVGSFASDEYELEHAEAIETDINYYRVLAIDLVSAETTPKGGADQRQG